MSDSPIAEWLGREDLAWNILLVARMPSPPRAEMLHGRLAGVAAREGWSTGGPLVVEADDLDELVVRLSEVRDPNPVSVGRSEEGVVVRAHHAHVGGLGLLAVLREVLDDDLTSTAGGVGARPGRSTLATIADRLLEAVVRPPAGVAAPATAAPTQLDVPGDVFAARTLPRTVRTAEVAHAAVQAVRERNQRAGVRGSRVALAVGVSTVDGSDLRVGDDSGFLRLAEAERLDVSSLSAELARTPLQVGGTARNRSARRLGWLIRWASRVFSSRLGSTLLVSHLGRITGSTVSDVAFYPLAGNGSGVSVGAATVDGRTTLTIRARGAQHGTADLAELLDAIAARLS